MNGIEIKEKRIKLGLTQEELANLIGVSKNTVLNYEKGNTIPDSKIKILESVLNKEYPNIANEPKTTYGLKGYDLKIKQAEEEILVRKSMLEVLEESDPNFSHLQTIIKLLEDKIGYIKLAKKNHDKE